MFATPTVGVYDVERTVTKTTKNVP